MGADRMKPLALAAADEAMQMNPRLQEAQLPVLLALPAPRPDFDEKTGVGLARSIIEALPISVDKRSCAAVLEGHAGGVKLLLTAERLLADGVAPAVLVGGVESYRDLATLRFIERTGRLRTEDDALGWIPGEGACFLLLTTATNAARLGVSPVVTLDAAATSIEPKPWYSGQPTIGAALTEALRAVFVSPGVPVETYCDLNGEPWRADEWGYVYLRTARHYVEPLALHHPADCWGDVGAASGPMLIALAAQNMMSHRSASARALVWTASDTGPLRAACVLRRN